MLTGIPKCSYIKLWGGLSGVLYFVGFRFKCGPQGSGRDSKRRLVSVGLMLTEFEPERSHGDLVREWNDWFVCLLRTSPMEDGNKHAGLSQILIDLKSPGLEISPIPFLDGSHHFNEVTFNEVFVPDINVVGDVGMGWHQNTTEMAYERGGPDRWLSPFSTVEQLLREAKGTDLEQTISDLFGELVARWWGIRNLSLSVARLIDTGEAPSIESSLVKEMGTRYEQEVVEKLVHLIDLEYSPDSDSLFERLLAQCVVTFPGNTIRGGTIEILRSVASKGLKGLPA